MSAYLDLLVEQQIREAMARGEFDDLPGAGKPLADLDQQRQPGWFADQLVRRERSRVLHDDTVEELAGRRVAFWRAASPAEVRELVVDANRLIASANRRLLAEDQIELVDLRSVMDAWRTSRTP